MLRVSGVVATGLLLFAGALVAPSSAALAPTSATLYVNVAGTATTRCTSGTPCKTIQDAVNEAAGGTNAAMPSPSKRPQEPTTRATP